MGLSDKKVYNLPVLVWWLILGTGLSRTAFFMAFPFLAIHLKQKLNLDVTTIGWIIGIGPLMGAAVGFFGGYLSDIIGRRWILVICLTLWGITQMGFGFANSVLMFTIVSSLNGVFRSIVEPLIQALISDNTTTAERTRAFHYRYFVVNVGAAIGPLAGAWILLSSPALGFVLSGCSLMAFGLFFLLVLPSDTKTKLSHPDSPKMAFVISLLLKDKALRLFVLASVLCSVAYAQIESTLPIHLEEILGEKGIRIFSWVISANAITIVALQLWMNRITSKLNIERTVAVSCLVMGLGFLGFAFSSALGWAYIMSSIVISLGETLVFSNGYLLIDKLAPKNLKGTYHSVSNMFVIGLALGPLVGAWVFKKAGSPVLFCAAFVVMVGSALCYYFGGRHVER